MPVDAFDNFREEHAPLALARYQRRRRAHQYLGRQHDQSGVDAFVSSTALGQFNAAEVMLVAGHDHAGVTHGLVQNVLDPFDLRGCT